MAFQTSRQHTRVLSVDVAKLADLQLENPRREVLDWSEPLVPHSYHKNAVLEEAASLLLSTDIPVAFPTETVYGLGADATRSSAVQGIYRAKQRPLDNPLIVHVGSIAQIRRLFRSSSPSRKTAVPTDTVDEDPIPQVYHALIQRFWPGPLTILMPLPNPSPFAPEVTAGLPTVGVRMPASAIALALIRIAGVPLAAPSANASTKPSPTTAAHVLFDLEGRIDLILDGGPCAVGVESTVVDGLHDPPLILRPGGVSLEMLRVVPGWENVKIGYEDKGQKTGVPRAPGMKYKHYSPRARVLLFTGSLTNETVQPLVQAARPIGVVRTSERMPGVLETAALEPMSNGSAGSSTKMPGLPVTKYRAHLGEAQNCTLLSLALGPSMKDVAKGLFSALRALDEFDVSVIFVESVDTDAGDEAPAVMNRLRKAAESEV